MAVYTHRGPGKRPAGKSDMIPTPGQKGLARARSKATVAAKAKFLSVLAECGCVSIACRACDRSTRTLYWWRDVDPAFAEAWADALTKALALLEEEAWRRAVEGVEEPVVSGGRVVTTVRRHSDMLLKVLLQAHAPEKYRQSPVNVGVQAEGPMTFTLKIDGPPTLRRPPEIEHDEGDEAK